MGHPLVDFSKMSGRGTGHPEPRLAQRKGEPGAPGKSRGWVGGVRLRQENPHPAKSRRDGARSRRIFRDVGTRGAPPGEIPPRSDLAYRT